MRLLYDLQLLNVGLGRTRLCVSDSTGHGLRMFCLPGSLSLLNQGFPQLLEPAPCLLHQVVLRHEGGGGIR